MVLCEPLFKDCFYIFGLKELIPRSIRIITLRKWSIRYCLFSIDCGFPLAVYSGLTLMMSGRRFYANDHYY